MARIHRIAAAPRRAAIVRFNILLNNIYTRLILIRSKLDLGTFYTIWL